MGEIRRIGLLEDVAEQAELGRKWLTEAGYEVTTFDQAGKLVAYLRDGSFDLLLLDWELPDSTGIEVMRWLRETRLRRTPVIMLTQRSSGEDAAAALRAGANDFVRKPADRDELLARVALALRDSVSEPQASIIEFGQFRLDKNKGAASRAGTECVLTPTQFQLAWLLFEEIGRPVSRERLTAAVWGRSVQVESRTLDAHVSVLRGKLGLKPEFGLKLSSVYGYGYRLQDSASTSLHGDADAAQG